VVVVAAVAAVISYRHAYELVRAHGESGTTARLVPFTVDGLIWAASMAILDATRRTQPVPALAKWSLGVGIAATISANLAHGISHGPIGAIVSAWPTLAPGLAPPNWSSGPSVGKSDGRGNCLDEPSERHTAVTSMVVAVQ